MKSLGFRVSQGSGICGEERQTKERIYACNTSVQELRVINFYLLFRTMIIIYIYIFIYINFCIYRTTRIIFAMLSYYVFTGTMLLRGQTIVFREIILQSELQALLLLMHASDAQNVAAKWSVVFV